MKSNYKRIGDFIQLVDERNTNLEVTLLLGLSISKNFIPSVANTVGTNMKSYKIIRKNQFACSTMQVRRDKKMPVALLQNYDEAIISQAYPVFEIKDTNKLLPEYLMMWFSRTEFDRHAEFLAVGGVRGTLEWEDFLDMEFPVPSIEKQREIVKEYNVVVNRIKLNEKFNKKLEESAQAIYKEWFVDFEFPFDFAQGKPDEKGKPYKSGGGEMVFNEVLGREIPVGWEDGVLGDLACYTSNKVSINDLNLMNYISTENMLPNCKGVIKASSLPNASFVSKFQKNELLISNIRPYFKKIWRATFDGGCSNDILCLIPQNNISSFYLYYALEKNSFFDYVMAGSKGTKMPRGDKNWIIKYKTIIPNYEVINLFNIYIIKISSIISYKQSDSNYSLILSKLVLSKMATIKEL